jgi:hypothetical protein
MINYSHCIFSWFHLKVFKSLIHHWILKPFYVLCYGVFNLKFGYLTNLQITIKRISALTRDLLREIKINIFPGQGWRILKNLLIRVNWFVKDWFIYWLASIRRFLFLSKCIHQEQFNLIKYKKYNQQKNKFFLIMMGLIIFIKGI